jgi:hypothetical protein
MSKDAYYFSHDSNARNDLKIVKLRRLLGLEGYGMYWCVIEMLRESNGYELPIDDISDICYELRIEEEKFNKLFECDLITKDKKTFYSKSLKERMLRLDEIKQKRRIAGAKGGKSKAIGKQLVSISEASKVKQSKEDKYNIDCAFKAELTSYFDYLEEQHHRSIGHMQIEQTLKMLSQWYQNDKDIKQCLAANIANGWKTINYVKPENGTTTKQVNPWNYDT